MSRARILADYVSSGDELATVTTTANAALPKAGGTMTGNIVMGDDTSIGIGDAAERIEFDGAGDISVLGANLGIGTDAPTKQLTLSGAATQTLRFNDTEGNCGTNDVLGTIDWKSADAGRGGDPAASIKAISGTADGSTTHLLFSTQADANAATERMRIDHNGKVGIGAGASPSGTLDVHHTSGAVPCINTDYSVAGELGLSLYSTATGTTYGMSVQFSSNATNNGNGTHNWFFRGIHSASTVAVKIWDDGDAQNINGTWTSGLSDERLKTNITDVNSQWDDVKNINIVNYKILTQGGEKDFSRIGVIAQQVAGVSPNLVKERVPEVEEIKANPLFGTLYEEEDDIPEGKEVGDVKEVKEMVKTFKDSIFFWKCAKALQEAMVKIETLETENTALKTRMDALEARITALEG